MKIYIILFFTALLSCKNDKNINISRNKSSASLVNSSKITTIACNDFIVEIGIDDKDFKVLQKKDSIEIYKELYGSIDEKQFKIIKKNKEINNLKIVENIQIGFFQTLNDEIRGSELDVYYDFKNNPKIENYKFSNAKCNDFKKVLYDNYFSEIKQESIQKQTNFFKKVLTNENHKECCPEYIAQANDFLKKQNDSFTNFDLLNITPFIKTSKLIIKYQINKINKECTIILNDFSEEKKYHLTKKIVNNKRDLINSWIYNPSKDYSFNIELHKSVNLKNTEQYFDLAILQIKLDDKELCSNKIIRIPKKNSPYSAFEKIVFKNNYLTIEQYGNNNEYMYYEYITFINNKDNFHLHKYSVDYTSKIDPDKNIPSKTWTTKDFGEIKFEDVTQDFIINLIQNEPEK